MELPPEAARIARQQSYALWNSLASRRTGSYDREDIEQEAMLIAWRWCQDHDVTINGGLLTVVVRRRLIDWLRDTTSYNRRRGSQPQVDSLDETYDDSDDPRLTLADPAAESARNDVEQAFDLSLAFDSYDGPPRDAEAAQLVMQGLTLREVGALFGVTESRACQMRTKFITTTAGRWGTEPTP